jgi:hypothetical protein
VARRLPVGLPVTAEELYSRSGNDRAIGVPVKSRLALMTVAGANDED